MIHSPRRVIEQVLHHDHSEDAEKARRVLDALRQEGWHLISDAQWTETENHTRVQLELDDVIFEDNHHVADPIWHYSRDREDIRRLCRQKVSRCIMSALAPQLGLEDLG